MPRRKSRKSRKGRRRRGGGAGCSLEDSNKMIIQNGGGFMDAITGAFSSVGSAITTAGSNVKAAASNTVNNAKRKVEETKNMVGDRVNSTLAAAKGESPAPVEPASEVPVEDSEISSEVSTEPVMVGTSEALGELDPEEEERRKSLANLQPSVGGRRKRRRKTKRKSRRKRRKTKRRSRKRRKRRRTRRRRGGMCGCEKK